MVVSDLTPELFVAGREFAARHGVQVDWEEGDVEALPHADRTFDVVLSCIGVMFAPHHQRAADELVRVCRPGGTIGSDLTAIAARFDRGTDTTVMDWEYMILTARKRS